MTFAPYAWQDSPTPMTATLLRQREQAVYDAALADAKAYADSKDVSGDAATLIAAQTYTDQQVAATPQPGSAILTPRVWVPAMAPSRASTGAWIWTQSTAHWFGVSFQSSGAQSEWVEYDVLLQAGTYDLTLLNRKGPNLAIYTVSLDGTDVGAVDGYSATSINGKEVVAGLTVASSGVHTLKLRVDTRNAANTASPGYYAVFQALSLIRV